LLNLSTMLSKASAFSLKASAIPRPFLQNTCFHTLCIKIALWEWLLSKVCAFNQYWNYLWIHDLGSHNQQGVQFYSFAFLHTTDFFLDTPKQKCRHLKIMTSDQVKIS
jgi:hypothetical protein